jgi:predicted nucleic-acid-binding protein
VIGLDTNVLARYFVEEADADSATEAHLEPCSPEPCPTKGRMRVR